MNPKWNFDTCHSTNRQVSPTSSYLFSSNDNPLLYLVREAVQNSLDAKLQTSNCSVKSIISISPIEPNAREYFAKDLVNRAKASQILKSEPKSGVLLTYEDCHTSGLTGDHASNDGKNDSYAGFAFHEGTSNKQTNARGKFGIGKQVFIMLSGLNSYFVLSKTSIESEHEFLFGISTLDYHNIGKVKYQPYGYWGFSRSKGATNPLPVKYDTEIGEKYIDGFRETFKIKRKINESGTSIVVPYAEINYSKDYAKLKIDIISIILNEYLIPVLNRDIEFEIHIGNEAVININFESINSFIANIQDTNKKIFLEELHKNALSTLEKEENNAFDMIIDLTTSDIADGKFSGFLSNTILVNQFTDLYNKPLYDTIVIAVNLPLRSDNSTTGRMIICLSKNFEGTSSPIYIRNGLVISHANNKKMGRGLSSLVYIPPKDSNKNIVNELSNFLNACENPAHTTWSTSGDQFKRSDYKKNSTYSEGVLRVVKQFVFGIENLVSSGNNVIIKNHFTELFSGASNKPGLSPTGAKGGAKPGNPTGSKIYDSNFTYNEGANIYTLEINPADKITSVKFNYLNRDYSKSKYKESHFKLVASKPLEKELGISSKDMNFNIVSGNLVSIALSKSIGTITITGANKYKILGVELI